MIDLNSDNVRIVDGYTYGDYTVTMGFELTEPFVNVQNEKVGMNNTYFFQSVNDMESAFNLLEGVLDEIHE